MSSSSPSSSDPPKKKTPQGSSAMDPAVPPETPIDQASSSSLPASSNRSAPPLPPPPPPPPPPVATPQAQYTPYQYVPYQYQSYPGYPSYESYDTRSRHLFTSDRQQYPQQYPYTVVPQGWMLWRLKEQIEFYFSFENLVRDEYLTQQLLSHGGYAVPCYVVGGFPKVREIMGGQCASPQILQQALHYSLVVCVHGDMLVPLTNALTQAMNVRRQGSIYAAGLESLPSSRYSPQTTTTDDTTTTSCYSASAVQTAAIMEMPGGAGFSPELVPPFLAETPQLLEPTVMATNWPVGVTQQPVTPYTQMYDVVNRQQVPYGYTVTTESAAAGAAAPQESHRNNSYTKKKRGNNQRKRYAYNRNQNGNQNSSRNSSNSSNSTEKQAHKQHLENGEPTQNKDQQNQPNQQSSCPTAEKNNNGNNEQPHQNTEQKPQQSHHPRHHSIRGSKRGRRKSKTRVKNDAVPDRSGTGDGGIALAQGLQGLSLHEGKL